MIENQPHPAPETKEPADATNIEKTERKPVFKVVPLVDDFAPGVDPDNLKEILGEMDVAAYLEQERGSPEQTK